MVAIDTSTPADLERQAIHERIEIVPYDRRWRAEFAAECERLTRGFPATFSRIEHVGSTAVAGLPAKPVIDIVAIVASMGVADAILPRLVEAGYSFSAEFNERLGDSRWLMKHANGRRTHHLHLVLAESMHWTGKIRFRDLLRSDAALAARYAALKKELAAKYAQDRDAYTEAKTLFVNEALASAGNGQAS